MKRKVRLRKMDSNLNLKSESDKIKKEYVWKKLRTIFYDCLKVQDDEKDINLDSQLQNYGMNSVDFIRIIASIEEEFEFEFNDEDLNINKFKNVRSILDYILEKTS